MPLPHSELFVHESLRLLISPSIKDVRVLPTAINYMFGSGPSLFTDPVMYFTYSFLTDKNSSY